MEGDVVQPLQVQSVEQQLLAGRATLLNDQQDYLQALDSFKLEIGVPMQLNIEMDDSDLQPLIKQYRRARAITETSRLPSRRPSKLIALEMAPRLRTELLRLFQHSKVVQGTTVRRAGFTRGGLSGRSCPARTWMPVWKTLEGNRQGPARPPGGPPEAREAPEPGRASPVESGCVQNSTWATWSVPYGCTRRTTWKWASRKSLPTQAGERQRIRQFQGVLNAWQKVLVEARDEQWDKVRATWPELPRCCVDGVDLVKDDLAKAQAAAAKHALENRLDLMNTRAQVVDAWRQLAVYANALLGTFTVQYQLSANSPLTTAQPLNIGGSGTSHQLILNTELPLTRFVERNNYRASLIAFQRQRRALQEAEDLTVQFVYNELYLLRQYAETYKVQKRQIELAYLTIDSSLESLSAPTAPPSAPGLTRGAANDGPAALTQQLLSAQRSLPTAQNGLLTIWINYLDARLQLYRDLELMPLDERGVWIDQIRDCDCKMNAEQSSGPGMPPVPGKEQMLPPPQVLPAPALPR